MRHQTSALYCTKMHVILSPVNNEQPKLLKCGFSPVAALFHNITNVNDTSTYLLACHFYRNKTPVRFRFQITSNVISKGGLVRFLLCHPD